jgi:hypothetical protein
MTLFEQTDLVLAQYANQLAGRSIAFDKFIYDIVDLSLLNGGVFLAAFWWLWFEAGESGVHAQRRNVRCGRTSGGHCRGRYAEQTLQVLAVQKSLDQKREEISLLLATTLQVAWSCKRTLQRLRTR